jgi:maltose alpha-D-glucosyltransferase / alpha-amylase
VNVAAQRRDPHSLLSWFERLIRRRRETPEFGFGTWKLIRSGVPAVLTHRCDWQDSTVVAVHNFSAEPCQVQIPLEGIDGVVAVDDLLDGDSGDASDGTIDLTIEGYGYRWLQVRREGQPPRP